ncbi:MAG: hypothetical protein JF615_11385 [Asticcacaulis sp.]|nr:hypothetical protein [Asticcacaulis sp.]
MTLPAALPELAAVAYDSVVIHALKPGFEIFESQKHARCSEEDANRVYRLLNALREDETARCFTPGFRVELFQGETMVFGANICWDCYNMRMDGTLATRSATAFDAASPPAQALLELCQSVVAGSTSDGGPDL